MDDELSPDALGDVLDALPLPVVVIDEGGRVVHTNEAADEAWPFWEGGPFVDTLPEEAREAARTALAAPGGGGFDMVLRRGARPATAWTLRLRPTPAGVAITGADVTAMAEGRDEAREEVASVHAAIGEINHRMSNLFTLLPAVVKLSLRRSVDLASARKVVVGRIAALASAQSMTVSLDAIRDGISLDEMIEAVLLEFETDRDRVVTSGPPVHLATRGSNTVALALHELAINAARFGALAQPAGRVRIAWAIENSARDAAALPEDAQNVLRLLWSETGGPPIPGPPSRRGFGLEVIDRLIASQGGTIEREWLQHGLAVTIDLPLYPLGHEPKFGGDLKPQRGRAAPPPPPDPLQQRMERALGIEPAPRPPERSAPVRAGPSETEIVGRLERIIRRANG